MNKEAEKSVLATRRGDRVKKDKRESGRERLSFFRLIHPKGISEAYSFSLKAPQARTNEW